MGGSYKDSAAEALRSIPSPQLAGVSPQYAFTDV